MIVRQSGKNGSIPVSPFHETQSADERCLKEQLTAPDPGGVAPKEPAKSETNRTPGHVRKGKKGDSAT